MPLDPKEIARLFAVGDAATTTTAKGNALEDLVCHMFEALPGIEIAERNRMNAFDTEEIDVALLNNQDPNGLYFFPYLILIECKNWSSTVGSNEVSWFINKLRSRGLEYGVLVAANGITGQAKDVDRAHFEIATALGNGFRVIVITRTEIEALTTEADLILLIKRKICELVVTGTALA